MFSCAVVRGEGTVRLESIYSASLLPHFAMLLTYNWFSKIHFFSHKILHKTHHNDNIKKVFSKVLQALFNTLLMHVLQQSQPQVFLNIMPQAPSGWMGSFSPPCLDPSRDGQSVSNLGSGWATQGQSQRHLSWSHCDIILAVCFGLLSCWKKSSRAAWSRFSSRKSLYFSAFIFPSVPTSLLVPAAEKLSHSIGFLVTALTRVLSPRSLSLGGRPARGRVLVVPNFFH